MLKKQSFIEKEQWEHKREEKDVFLYHNPVFFPKATLHRRPLPRPPAPHPASIVTTPTAIVIITSTVTEHHSHPVTTWGSSLPHSQPAATKSCPAHLCSTWPRDPSNRDWTGSCYFRMSFLSVLQEAPEVHSGWICTHKALQRNWK